jgi:hypothetical protein
MEDYVLAVLLFERVDIASDRYDGAIIIAVL